MFADCAAESYLLEWVRDDVPARNVSELKKYFLPGTQKKGVADAVSPAGSRREVWDSSLNFRLDRDLTTEGTRTFEAQVFAVGSGRENPPHPDHLRTLTATFDPRIDLHVYGLIWVATNHDDSPGYDYTGVAPPWSDFEGHRRVVENILPVSSLSIDPLPGVGARAPDPQPFGNLSEARAWAQQKLTEFPEGAIIYMLQNWDWGGFHGLASTFWHKCWDGQQWLPDKPSWLPLLGKSHNRAVLASWGPGRLDVFVRGLDTGVYTKSLKELIWSVPV